MTKDSDKLVRSLDEELEEFQGRRMLAMPIAGMITWAIILVAALTQSLPIQVLTLYIANGMTVYMGLALSKLTGENLTAKGRPTNRFDKLFMLSVAQALLVFAIIIPAGLQDPYLLPMGIGIMTGLMWLPMSWILGHWIGIFHAVTRTVLCLTVWILAPELGFVAVPLIVLAVYAVSVAVLERRWRALGTTPDGSPCPN